MRFVVFVVLVSAGAVLSCKSPTAPDLGPYNRARNVFGITTNVVVTPSSIQSGDSIDFTAWAHNSTDHSIQIGERCGPAMDVIVDAQGEARGQSALIMKYGPDIAFTCQLSPS